MKPAKACTGAVPKAASRSSGDPGTSSHQGRSLAHQATLLCRNGRFQEAASLYTQAIDLEPLEARYFSNRSLCYLNLKEYHQAVLDADTAVSLDPQLPKPHFFRGRAKMCLGKYREAIECFETVLRLNPSLDEARAELHSARLSEITKAGAGPEQAEELLKRTEANLDAALDALRLSGNAAAKPAQATEPCSDGPRHLAVKNITHEMTREMLMRIFVNYGRVLDIKMMYEDMWALVEFRKPAAAYNAMTGWQGEMLCGKALEIELVYTPSTPAGDSASPVSAPTAESSPAGATARPALNHLHHSVTTPRRPVGGVECRFWRGTGCRKGDRCLFKHVAAHKGIDR